MSDYTQTPPPPPVYTPEPPPRPWYLKKRYWALGAAGALFVVAGIVASAEDDAPTRRTAESPTTTETVEAPATEPPAVPEPTAPPTTAPSIASVGPNEWYDWEDGLSAQVTSVERFTPDYDSTPTPDILLTVTVRNNTGQVYDASMAMVNVYGGPNGTQAEGEYSFYGFDGSVPQGATATAQWSFTVPEEHMNALRIEFTPSFEHNPAFFQGAV